LRVLVVGGGGREHALCWRLAEDSGIERLYVAPGNAGIAAVATLEPISAGDLPGLRDFAEREAIELTIVGPEAPLVAGLADELRASGLAVFGPTREAAQLEGSKVWARHLCDAHGIPAPRSREFEEVGPALDYLGELSPPYVIKADGLAAGKGVTLAEDRAAAEAAIQDLLIRRLFGEAGRRVLVEEFLEGSEVSAMGLTDGRTVLPLALAQDHKRAFDGDLGPNTGGMGAFSPVPSVNEALALGILEATVQALRDEGIDYRGVLYAGLMITAEGPKVLEYNCRFGDPETQVVLPRLASNLTGLLMSCAEGDLAGRRAAWTDEACVGVVLASAGYPGSLRTGMEITGLGEAAKLEGVRLFHSGTALREGRVVTSGGRVLTVAALGSDLEEARRRAYEACSVIAFEGMHYRRDIAGLGARGIR
jgi:phosphoribosylamine--glycine ligase